MHKFTCANDVLTLFTQTCSLYSRALFFVCVPGNG